MRILVFLSGLLFLFGCEVREQNPPSTPLSGTKAQLPERLWQAELDLGEKTLPFRFKFYEEANHLKVTLLNAEEEISIPDVNRLGDSIVIRMPFFDSEIRGKRSADKMTGTWYNYARSNNNQIPFQAEACKKNCRRVAKGLSVPDLAPEWEVTFVHDGQDSSKALGKFTQDAELLSGTFMTSTGDYRFLEGDLDQAGNLSLACFDGAHAFLFEASLQADGSLKGGFWSGTHWYESWTAVPTTTFRIENPDSLTKLKSGYETIAFAFPDVDSNIVSLKDDRFQEKVVIVEIMGSWCPNCRDETVLLHEMYREMNEQGLEIVSLSFELKDDFAYGIKNIRRMQKAFGLEYPILFAGKAGRKTAGAAMPMLNHVMSYPTTIFVDRTGKVRRIFTGFSGPATGETYTRLVADFRAFTQKLLQESPS